MLDAARRSLARTFDYDGRSGRGEYFAYVFGSLVCTMLGPLLLLIAIPGFAATVRRLHDMDRSGRWAVLPAAPLLMFIAAALLELDYQPAINVIIVAIVFAPLGFLFWMSRPGTDGPNRYGAPDGPSASSPAAR